MKEKYGIGIVGLGMIAQFHAKAIADMNDAQLVACFSRSEKKSKAFSEQHNCRPYSDYNDFLSDPDLDIVAIATPSGYHLEPGVRAAQAGKHLLCEKPIEITSDRVAELRKACEENGVTLGGIFPRRFNHAVSTIKDAVDRNRLGTLTLASAYVKWHRTQAYYDSDVWRRTWEGSGGGALMNQSIHHIDMLLHFAGDVESVSAYKETATHQGIEVEDLAVASLKFKNGALGTIEGTTTAYSKKGHAARIELCGSEGSVFLSDNIITTWDFAKPEPEDEEILQRYGSVSQGAGAGAADPSAIDYREHLRNFQAFTQALREGRTPSVDGAESSRAVRLIEAIYESARLGGQAVRL